MPIAPHVLSLGWSHYQAGNPAQAEQVFRQALDLDPDNADVWCLLGIVCRAQGHHAAAVASYREALKRRPDFVEGLNNLGNVLVDQGQFEEAADCYRQVLRLRPDYAQAHNNLGVAYRFQGKFADAAACYREALRLKPDYTDACNNLGDALKALGQLHEAAGHYERALRLNPNYAEAHNNLGTALVKLGRFDEAIAHHQRALELKPRFADAWNNLANAYLAQRKPQEAVSSYREALRIRPDYAEALSNLGIALAELREFDEALACYREALRLKPDYPEAYTNMGNVFQELGRLDEALAHYEKALRLKPDYAEAYDNRAQAEMAGGNLAGARAGFESALRLKADYAEAHLGRAFTLLLQGDFEAGWAEYEWRWKCKEFTPFAFQQPVWDGSPLAGRTILLHAEQGLGDTLQFIRYAALVKERGGRVLVACQKPLLPILKGCPGVDQWVPYDAPLPDFDVYAPLLSLPRLFGTSLASIPAAVPYVFADAELIERWGRELDRYTALKVGVAWQGNPRYSGDRKRSFPLEKLAPVATLPNVQLFSLQKGPGAEQIAGVADQFSVIDLGSQLDEKSGPFMDTGAVMKNLDLVISADTAIGHLAGALGVPLWLALPFVAEWRWLLGRKDSPWYPTVRLFRQSRPGDWDAVFKHMAQELKKQPAPCRARPITVAIAPGELVDKITILEIKSARVKDEAKLANIRNELAALVAARDRALQASKELADVIAELKAVNEQLWQVEDDLRSCERAKAFGAVFIDLARQVYRLNDRRAALKRRINETLHSEFIEEKEYSAAVKPRGRPAP
ncbi:MAG TPA: DUF6165 family protein [Gemmataceae bacterium]|nr:DUF6165 family protein [Gemmataceae bacterium]